MQPVSYGSEAAGDGRLLSPAIWSDCLKGNLVADGTGIWFFDDFLGGVADTVASSEQRPIVGRTFSIDCDDDTVLSFKASERGGYQDIETDGDDNDAFAIFTEPFCKLVKDSGNKVWLEARLEIGDADGDQGFFFGLGEEACQSRDVVADGCADLITETLVGYRIFTGEDAIDAVAQKDDGDESVILSDVTNQDILDTKLGSDSAGAKAALADATEMKLGIYFDGKTTVHFFVNGVEVATDELDTTSYDPDKDLCMVCALKTGTGAAESIAIDWIAGAYEEAAE
jgi:hypothetical protein